MFSKYHGKTFLFRDPMMSSCSVTDKYCEMILEQEGSDFLVFRDMDSKKPVMIEKKADTLCFLKEHLAPQVLLKVNASSDSFYLVYDKGSIVKKDSFSDESIEFMDCAPNKLYVEDQGSFRCHVLEGKLYFSVFGFLEPLSSFSKYRLKFSTSGISTSSDIDLTEFMQLFADMTDFVSMEIPKKAVTGTYYSLFQ